MSEKVRAVYNSHALNAAEDDFWSQSARTVQGVPVGEDQIAMIEEAIVSGLELAPDDTVLDLCCGNGALSDRIFSRCAGGVGVDFAEHQIAVARRFFERRPERRFELAEIADFLANDSETARFTKGLSYGSFAYLSAAEVFDVLATLRRRFVTIRRFFVGNLPDRDAVGEFYFPGTYSEGIEDDHESAIGRWWYKSEFADVAMRAGWSAAFRSMAPAFYAAYYRYDVVLTPLEGQGTAAP